MVAPTCGSGQGAFHRARFRNRRVEELCVLPVAPFSVHIYVAAVSEALSALAAKVGRDAVPDLVPVSGYGDDRALVTAHAAQIAPLLSGRSRESTALVLTAHSLPVSVLAAGHIVDTVKGSPVVATAWAAAAAYMALSGYGLATVFGKQLE